MGNTEEKACGRKLKIVSFHLENNTTHPVPFADPSRDGKKWIRKAMKRRERHKRMKMTLVNSIDIQTPPVNNSIDIKTLPGQNGLFLNLTQ
jgi:hypothetical protein